MIRNASPPFQDPARPGVIIVSNRAPLVPTAHGGWSRGSGGLVRAVHPALGAQDRWIAAAAPRPGVSPGPAPSRLAPYGLRFVPLPDACEQRFGAVCNRVLWFALHGIDPGTGVAAEVAELWEQGYVPANAAFASAVADEHRLRPAPVLLQDFHLFGCASAVRTMVPEARIALFCHTPFPGPRMFSGLPSFIGADILRSLLACDLVGFQSRCDAAGFVRAATSVLGARAVDDTLSWAGRRTRLGVFPVGVDAAEIARESRLAVATVPVHDDERVVVWAGRTDPVKNPTGAIAAYRRVLESDPSMRGRVRLLMKLQPSRQEFPEYAECLRSVRREADALNRDVGTAGWEPVLIDDSPERSRAIAALRRADVLLVNSIADGMNLIVHETVVVGTRDPAVVLARTTGAFEHFADAVISVAPHDERAVAGGLAEALDMGPPERKVRMQALRERVASTSPRGWLDAQLARLDQTDVAADRELSLQPAVRIEAVPVGR